MHIDPDLKLRSVENLSKSEQVQACLAELNEKKGDYFPLFSEIVNDLYSLGHTNEIQLAIHLQKLEQAASQTQKEIKLLYLSDAEKAVYYKEFYQVLFTTLHEEMGKVAQIAIENTQLEIKQKMQEFASSKSLNPAAMIEIKHLINKASYLNQFAQNQMQMIESQIKLELN